MSISYGDKSLATMRSLITVMDRELATTPRSDELRKAWTEMVEVLALGPEPQLRTCPSCGEIGMRAATRCSRCWSALTPLAPETKSLAT